MGDSRLLPLLCFLNSITMAVGKIADLKMTRGPRGLWETDEFLQPKDIRAIMTSAQVFTLDGFHIIIKETGWAEGTWADVLTVVLYLPIYAASFYLHKPMCRFINRDVSWFKWLRGTNIDDPFDPDWSWLLAYIVELAAVVLPSFALWVDMKSRLPV